MSARRIRVSCEVNFAGCEIEDEYYDLPENWDEMSPKEQEDHLVELSKDELSQYASSGAAVVDDDEDES